MLWVISKGCAQVNPYYHFMALHQTSHNPIKRNLLIIHLFNFSVSPINVDFTRFFLKTYKDGVGPMIETNASGEQ